MLLIYKGNAYLLPIDEFVVGGSQAVSVWGQSWSGVWFDQRNRLVVLMPSNLHQ